MSNTETHIGKLIPFKEGKELELFLDEQLKYHTDLLGYESRLLYWYYELSEYKNFYIHNNILYKVEDKGLNGEDIYEATSNEDGSISYTVQYYNGGCGFDEALDYAIKKII